MAGTPYLVAQITVGDKQVVVVKLPNATPRRELGGNEALRFHEVREPVHIIRVGPFNGSDS